MGIVLVSCVSRETELIEDLSICQLSIYYEELAHTVMGAEKSYICHLQAEDPGKLVM